MHIPDCVEKGQIPKFLFEIWKTKHGGDPVVDYEDENEGSSNGSGIGGGFLVCFALFSLFMMNDEPMNLRITIALILGIPGIIIVIWALRCKDPEDGNGHHCYSEIAHLFIKFDVEPTVELGKLSQEEFRGLIEDALTKQAKKVDEVWGFEKMKARTKFNFMHTVALYWGLCHESHARYYPKSSIMNS